MATIAGRLSLLGTFLAWAILWIPRELWRPLWDPWVYFTSIIIAGIAGLLGVIAGLSGSRWWFLSAILGFATSMLLVAGLE